MVLDAMVACPSKVSWFVKQPKIPTGTCFRKKARRKLTLKRDESCTSLHIYMLKS